MADRGMTLRERLVRLLGGVPERDVRVIQRRAYEAGMEDGNDEPPYTSGGMVITRGYVETGSKRRDLSAISQEKAIEASYRLWQTNPLAKALIEIYVDYILGDGVRVVAEHPDVQTALDTFWFDPVNALGDPAGGIGEGLEEIAREIWLFGELIPLLFERSGEDKGMVADGLVRFALVDPSSIYAVITDPKNVRDEIALRLKSETGGGDGPVYKIVRENPESGLLEGATNFTAYRQIVNGSTRQRISEAELRTIRRRVSGAEWIVAGGGDGRLQLREAENPLVEAEVKGSCFYFRVNKISTGVRGRPELLAMIDWLDRFDQVFFDGAEHAALLNMFSWDLKIEGGSETSPDPETNLRLQAQKVAKLKPGSAYAHNERVELTAKNPDLKTSDLETLIRQLRVFIAGGARVPEHWIAEGGYTNRATSAEMGKPTYRMLRRKQGVVKRILTMLCRYQIDVLVGLGLLSREVPVLGENGLPTGKTIPARLAFRVVMPDISEEDTNQAARTLASVAQALLPLVAGQIIPKKPALEVLAAVLELLDVELDVQASLEEEGGLPRVDQTVLELLKRLEKPEPSQAEPTAEEARENEG